MSAAYLDASAAVKLVVEEEASAALREALREWPVRVSSELLAIELSRTARRRLGVVPAGVGTILGQCVLHPIDRDVVLAATVVGPAAIATLDSIHLATALLVREAIGVFVSYDRRLLAAADAFGLPVAAP